MKRHFTALLLGFLFIFSASGQEIYENKWFGGAGGGMNFGLEGAVQQDRNFSKLGAGTAIDAWIGKRFSDWIGVKAGYQGLDISDRYTRYGAYHYHYAHADLMMMRNKHVMPYLHGGYLRAGQPHEGMAAGGVGIMAPIHLGKSAISIVPDLKLTLFNGKVLQHGKKVAGNLSGTIGVAFNLARPRVKKQEPVIYVPVVDTVVIVPPADTVYVPVVDTVYVPVVDTLQKISEEFTARIAGITLFDFDRFNLRNEAFPVLNDIATWLKDNPERTVLIEGYTDHRGSDAYNKVLSQRRADAVKNYLVKAGIDAARIEAIGHGKGDFKQGKTAEEIHQQNRRVVITVR